MAGGSTGPSRRGGENYMNTYHFRVPTNEALPLEIVVWASADPMQANGISYYDFEDEQPVDTAQANELEAADLDVFDKGLYMRHQHMTGQDSGRVLVFLPYTIIGSELLKIAKRNSFRPERPFNPRLAEKGLKDGHRVGMAWQHFSLSAHDFAHFEARLETESQLLGPVLVPERLDTDAFQHSIEEYDRIVRLFRQMLSGPCSPGDDLITEYRDLLRAAYTDVLTRRDASIGVRLDIMRVQVPRDLELDCTRTHNTLVHLADSLSQLPRLDSLEYELTVALAAWAPVVPSRVTDQTGPGLAARLGLLAKEYPLCRVLTATPAGNLRMAVHGVTIGYDGSDFAIDGDALQLLPHRKYSLASLLAMVAIQHPACSVLEAGEGGVLKVTAKGVTLVFQPDGSLKVDGDPQNLVGSRIIENTEKVSGRAARLIRTLEEPK